MFPRQGSASQQPPPVPRLRDVELPAEWQSRPCIQAPVEWPGKGREETGPGGPCLTSSRLFQKTSGSFFAATVWRVKGPSPDSTPRSCPDHSDPRTSAPQHGLSPCSGTEHLLRGRGILRLLGNRLSTHSTFLHVALRARHPAPARHHHHLPGLASTSPTATQGTRPSPPGQKSHPGLSTRTAPLWTPGLSTHPCLSGCRVPAARCLPSPGQPPGAGRNSTPLRRTQTLIAHGRSPRGSSASPQCREAGQFFALRPPPRPAARAGICAR